MANPKPVQRKLSVEDYLDGEKESVLRHEFVEGRVYAMAGASERHNIVKLNIAERLNASVSNSCSVFDGDMKLQVEPQPGDPRFYYPDVFVACAPADQSEHIRRDAVLIVEVLSQSTERVDRFEKFAAYTTLPMLWEYLLVAQDVPALDLYRRRTGWVCETFGPGASVVLESIGLTLDLDRIYRRVVF